MNHIRLPVLIFLGLALIALSTGAAEPLPAVTLPVSVAMRLELENDGGFGTRIDTRVGCSRWLLLGGGRWNSATERLAPGGYIERRYAPEAFLSNTWIAIGASAGPMAFGPLAPRGVLARAVDPTAGGWSWRALDEADRFDLDTSIDTPSRLGVALAWLPETGPGAGIWALENRDGIQWRGAALSVASSLSGRLTLLLGETLLSTDPRNPTTVAEEEWVYAVAPLRSDRYRRAGVGWRLETTGRPGLSLLGEVWGQRDGRAPVPGAYTGALRLDWGRWETGIRGTAAGPGLLDAWGNRVDRSRILTVGGRGRWGPPSNRRTGRLAWEHRGGWEDGVPGTPTQEVSLRLVRLRRDRLLQHSALDLSLKLESGEEDGHRRQTGPGGAMTPATLLLESWRFHDEGRPDAAAATLELLLRPRRRVVSPPGSGSTPAGSARRSAASLGGEVSLEWEADPPRVGWGVALSPGWRSSVGDRRRTLTAEAEVAIERWTEDDVFGFRYGFHASAPLGDGGRVAFDVGSVDQERTGRVVVEWRR